MAKIREYSSLKKNETISFVKTMLIEKITFPHIGNLLYYIEPCLHSAGTIETIHLFPYESTMFEGTELFKSHTEFAYKQVDIGEAFDVEIPNSCHAKLGKEKVSMSLLSTPTESK